MPKQVRLVLRVATDEQGRNGLGKAVTGHVNGGDRGVSQAAEAMRCMACGAEMILMNVAPDDTVGIRGFKHHTFRCRDDVERRLVFTKRGRESDAGLTPMHKAPSIVPTPIVPNEHAATPGIFRRVLARLRSR
jgi:hypothetical protein